ncbi:hypothetical protein PM082_012005 [Marasmius tenuissimus]|nr:hypothetical protein PM082_012005 [Marasmius tenuissimus]
MPSGSTLSISSLKEAAVELDNAIPVSAESKVVVKPFDDASDFVHVSEDVSANSEAPWENVQRLLANFISVCLQSPIMTTPTTMIAHSIDRQAYVNLSSWS